MARPDIAMAMPAATWLYFSRPFMAGNESPRNPMATTPIMVAMVVIPNVPATRPTQSQLCSAAGAISMGINASQGPKTKMINRLQAVTP